GNGNGNGNGNFLQDRSTTISAATPSSQQIQDILMRDLHQHQPQQPAPESDLTTNANTNANTFSKPPPTRTHMLDPTHAKDRSCKNTPSNCSVLAVQTSSSAKKNGKGRHASVAGVKSPSPSVTPGPLCFGGKNHAMMTFTSAAKHATAATMTLNPSLLF
ncbi:hypothetical protein AZE42_13773, partial [Rhizopogon vesiculosus]